MTSHAEQDNHPTPDAEHPQGADDHTPNSTITLRLCRRTVTFTGRRVTGIPDYFNDPPQQDQDVYLTAKDNVAVYDPNRLSLDVHDLEDFLSTHLATPVSWIVEDVLAAVPRPVEALDI